MRLNCPELELTLIFSSSTETELVVQADAALCLAFQYLVKTILLMNFSSKISKHVSQLLILTGGNTN